MKRMIFILFLVVLAACRQAPPQSFLDSLANEYQVKDQRVKVKIVNQWWDENRKGIYRVRVRITMPFLGQWIRADELYECERQGDQWSARKIAEDSVKVQENEGTDSPQHQAH